MHAWELLVGFRIGAEIGVLLGIGCVIRSPGWDLARSGMGLGFGIMIGIVSWEFQLGMGIGLGTGLDSWVLP